MIIITELNKLIKKSGKGYEILLNLVIGWVMIDVQATFQSIFIVTKLFELFFWCTMHAMEFYVLILD